MDKDKFFRKPLVAAGRGVVILLPLVVTLYVVFLLGSLMENYFGAIIRSFVSEGAYVPGMGLLFGVGLLLVAGWLVQAAFLQVPLRYVERVIDYVPLLKSVYRSIRDFTEYFGSRGGPDMNRVVLFQPMGEENGFLVGFRTSDGANPHLRLPENGDWCTVYLPMSYQVGGYTFVVPVDRVRDLDWSFEEAMRYVLTAGVKRPDAPRGQPRASMDPPP